MYNLKLLMWKSLADHRTIKQQHFVGSLRCTQNVGGDLASIGLHCSFERIYNKQVFCQKLMNLGREANTGKKGKMKGGKEQLTQQSFYVVLFLVDIQAGCEPPTDNKVSHKNANSAFLLPFARQCMEVQLPYRNVTHFYRIRECLTNS